MTKASAPRVLVEAVDAIAAGSRYLSHDVAQTLALGTSPADASASAMLSAREFEVLKLLAQGCALGEIAAALGLTVKTVANHQSSIRHKLGAETGAQLIRRAMQLGLVPFT